MPDTFLKSTVLAAISLGFSDFAIAISHAGVHSLVLNSPLEKTFAARDKELQEISGQEWPANLQRAGVAQLLEMAAKEC